MRRLTFVFALTLGAGGPARAVDLPRPVAPTAISPSVAVPSLSGPPLEARPETSTPFVYDPRAISYSAWQEPPFEATPDWRFEDKILREVRLWDGASAVEIVGEGAGGTVFVHPTREHAVVKIARRYYAANLGQYPMNDEQLLSYENFDLDRLAAAGAAPRPLAQVYVSGRPGSVRERIYGRTVDELKHDGTYGPAERGMIVDMLTRIAEAGFVVGDLHLSNIMIGRRGGDATPRAWAVDVLGVETAEDLDAAGRLAAMLKRRVPWRFGLTRRLDRLIGYRVDPDLR